MKNKNSKEKNPISRRTFINRTAAGTAFIALGPVTKLFAEDLQQVVPWPQYASEFTVHMVCHGHIDPVWLWPWSEGVAIVYSTFR